MIGLAGPVLAGLAWMAAAGAPGSFLAINGAALALALAAALWLPLPRGVAGRLAIAMAALVILALPLLFGIEVQGVSRWIKLGPVTLHAGYLALPILSVLAARMPSLSATAVMLAAAAICAAQPDFATVLGLCLASAALALVRRDRIAILGFLVALAVLYAVSRQPDLLAPVRFVEQVQRDTLIHQPIAGALLCLASILPGLWLVDRAERALPLVALTLGCGVAGLVWNYPSILIGFGAAPILGAGLALAALRQE